jgi:hypothetical protein
MMRSPALARLARSCWLKRNGIGSAERPVVPTELVDLLEERDGQIASQIEFFVPS